MLTGSLRHGRKHREHVARANWLARVGTLTGRRVPLAKWLGYGKPILVTIKGPASSVNHVLTSYDGAAEGDFQVRGIDEVELPAGLV